MTTQPAVTIELADTDHLECPDDVPTHRDATYRAIVWDYTGEYKCIGDIAEGDWASLLSWLADRGHAVPTVAFHNARAYWTAKLEEVA